MSACPWETWGVPTPAAHRDPLPRQWNGRTPWALTPATQVRLSPLTGNACMTPKPESVNPSVTLYRGKLRGSVLFLVGSMCAVVFKAWPLGAQGLGLGSD